MLNKKEYFRQYYLKNRDKLLESWRIRYYSSDEKKKEINKCQAESRRRARRKVIQHYGNKCACCGEERYEFLSIDHINGGGKKMGIYGDKLRWYIIRNKFPDEFRILCHNCNQALGAYGYCPHKEGSKVF